jgi:hypothetical protein
MNVVATDFGAALAASEWRRIDRRWTKGDP